jgi:hypothetical protein
MGIQFFLAINNTTIVKFIELGERDGPGLPNYCVRKQFPFCPIMIFERNFNSVVQRFSLELKMYTPLTC